MFVSFDDVVYIVAGVMIGLCEEIWVCLFIFKVNVFLDDEIVFFKEGVIFVSFIWLV